MRDDYRFTHANIDTTRQLLATLRNGKYAWPGGYPMYFLTSDGGALSFETVQAELASVVDSIRQYHSDGWRVIRCAINWEDAELTDDHSGELIESAYAE